MKRKKQNPAHAIPVPDFLLHRRRHNGEVQCGPSGVTIRQFRGAVEAFSRGKLTVLGREESIALKRRAARKEGKPETSSDKA
jgi:hypothetical protein